MSFSEDVGIHAQCHARVLLQGGGAFCQYRQFTLTLDVENQNSRFECEVDLIPRFSDTGEHHAARSRLFNTQHSLKFATRDDVKACFHLRQHLQQRKV